MFSLNDSLTNFIKAFIPLHCTKAGLYCCHAVPESGLWDSMKFYYTDLILFYLRQCKMKGVSSWAIPIGINNCIKEDNIRSIDFCTSHTDVLWEYYFDQCIKMGKTNILSFLRSKRDLLQRNRLSTLCTN